MAVAMLTLPRRALLSAAVFYTPVVMCLSGFMLGAKRWRCAMYSASSRSLIVRNPLGFSSMRMLGYMVVLNVSRHTCHSPNGL